MEVRQLSLIAVQTVIAGYAPFKTTSAGASQAAAVFCPGSATVITADAACFICWGIPGAAPPTALADGTQQYLAAGVPLRFSHAPNSKFAIISVTGTANVFATPET